MSGKTRIIIVGGFLGAGKTTLLWEAAGQLMAQGQRVGLITNDQAPELVDTALLSGRGCQVEEVSGSCFCCNFPGLLNAMAKLRHEAKSDVLLAEPVGSCTDLSATIMQPLKAQLGGELAVAPLSVLADPARLCDILRGGNAQLHPSAAYIFRKQLEEADYVLISKTDTLTAAQLAELRKLLAEKYPGATIFPVSVATGVGVEDWLQAVLAESRPAGQKLAVVDYDTYAEGEAVLGWFNATINLQGKVDWNAWGTVLLENLSRASDAGQAAVGHVKMMLSSDGKILLGNLTGPRETLSFRGQAGMGAEAILTLNARVAMAPERLELLIAAELAKASGQGIVIPKSIKQSLIPGRPNPTHRYSQVV